MYTSGKLGSSSISILTDFKKKNEKKHTQKRIICYTKNNIEKKD